MSPKSVNSHIVPRHHLKQFTNSVGCIFTYPDPDKHNDAQCISKGGGRVTNNTAAEIGYYSIKIEEVLDNKFENQGSRIALKILEKKAITSVEREFFVKYVASFIYRVPATESYFHRIYPNILKEMKSVEYFMQFRDRPDVQSVNEAEYFRILNDPNQEAKIIRQVWEQVIENEHQQVYDALLLRHWWVAEAIGDEYFITSNNPLFYSTVNGMADRNIQITFPLSQKMAMVFDGDGISSKTHLIEYYPASVFLHNQVDLINQRTADNSTQLYSPKRDIYVQKLLENRVSNTDPIRRSI